MKKGIKLFGVSILLTFSSMVFWGCEPPTTAEREQPTFSAEPPSKAQIVQVVEKAASIAVTTKMKATTPNTGQQPKYVFDEEEIKYDTETQQATVLVKLTWTAKKTRLHDTRDTCIMEGKLSVNFVNREYGSITATYMPTTINDWLKACLYDISESTALKRITFDPYK